MRPSRSRSPAAHEWATTVWGFVIGGGFVDTFPVGEFFNSHGRGVLSIRRGWHCLFSVFTCSLGCSRASHTALDPWTETSMGESPDPAGDSLGFSGDGSRCGPLRGHQEAWGWLDPTPGRSALEVTTPSSSGCEGHPAPRTTHTPKGCDVWLQVQGRVEHPYPTHCSCVRKIGCIWPGRSGYGLPY